MICLFVISKSNSNTTQPAFYLRVKICRNTHIYTHTFEKMQKYTPSSSAMGPDGYTHTNTHTHTITHFKYRVLYSTHKKNKTEN